jgi:hypothetical protein
MEIIELIKQPWAWYGPLVGLTVPALLILGNKILVLAPIYVTLVPLVYLQTFSSLHTIGKRNLEYVFIVGILIGGVILFTFYLIQIPIIINDDLRTELATYGITNIDGMLPSEISLGKIYSQSKDFFNGCGRFYDRFWLALCWRCTSGHAISGLSNLQVPSLIATCCFS